jgi:hypothetical protein
MDRSETTLQYWLLMPQVLLINSTHVFLHSSFSFFPKIRQLIELVIIKRMEENGHDDIASTMCVCVCTRRLSNNIVICRILIIISILLLSFLFTSLFSHSIMYCCSVFWPRPEVLPSIVFFFLYSVRSSSFNLFLHPSVFCCPFESTIDGKEEKKFAFFLSHSIIEWVSLC